MGYDDDADYAPEYSREPTNEELVRHGLKKHTETTAAANNAAKIALQTEQVAKSTLTELEKQGEQMKRVYGDLDHVEKNIDRSESLISWLSRCCWCCNCCRPENPEPIGGWERKHYKSKLKPEALAPRQQEAPSEVAASSSTDGGSGGADVKAAAQRIRDERRNPRADDGTRGGYLIGNEVDGPMGALIVEETRAQDESLRTIEHAVNNIHQMALQMNVELKNQETVLSEKEGKIDHVGTRLKNVSNTKYMRQFAPRR